MPGDHFVADINDHGHDIDEDEWACCQDDEYKCTIIVKMIIMMIMIAGRTCMTGTSWST